MEIPIQVAVRIYSGYSNEPSIIQSIPASSTPMLSPGHGGGASHQAKNNTTTAGIIQVDAHSFPFGHALPVDCSQDLIYHQSVYQMIGMFLEGFDASFVTYGQKGMGKTYTMLGHGFDCVFGESEQGIVQRCVRDIFVQLTHHPERNYVVNIGWVEVCDDEIHDLLDNSGNVPCLSVGDVFHWLQVGLANKSVGSMHSIFTLTLEQQWVTPGEGLIQHRLSTASFCDLCSTDRMLTLNSVEQHISVPKDLGLQALERIVHELADITDDAAIADVPYTQTTLTTLLKDSFGGRAQTLLILCVSPLDEDITETVHNLQFAFRAQCVRNFVLLNTYSDNNTPLLTTAVNRNIDVDQEAGDNFGLQFAASQWLKLVANAEGLFSRLIDNKLLNEQERERIEEWMFLKQECEECLSSGEINMQRDSRQLGPIQEADEQDDSSEQDEEEEETTSCQQNTDNESDTESHHIADLEDKMAALMEEFRTKTDNLIKDKYDEFVGSHPKAVLNSNDNYPVAVAVAPCDSRRTSSPRGRRKSLHPGVSLSDVDMARLNMAASQNAGSCNGSAERTNGFLDNSTDDFLLRSMTKDPREQLEMDLRKVHAQLAAAEQQSKELEGTIMTTHDLIATLSKRNDSQNKIGFNKKKAKLEADYQKYKKQLNKASTGHGYDRHEVERLRVLVNEKKQVLHEFLSLNNHDENQQKIKLHQKTLKAAKKKLDSVQKCIKKNRKHETELRNDKCKLAKLPSAVICGDRSSNNTSAQTIRDVAARISHLDHVIKEKSQSLQMYADGEERDSFRHEIRQLRRTRDHLVDSRCTLDRKLKKDKRLSHDEQRRLFECDEGIEAIDAAIEYKNEMICGGRKSVDTDESLQRERGARMMMERLNNLSLEEMRVLLYKYFQKAIDFRDSSVQMEKDRDFWESHARNLQNEIQRVRFESERRAAMLHQQQEAKLALYMRHINGTGGVDETTTTSSSCTTNNNNNSERILAALTPSSRHHRYTDGGGGGGGGGGELDYPTTTSLSGKHLIKQRHHTEIVPNESNHHHLQYKPLDKYKEKEKTSSSSSSRFFSKIQMFKTQYRGGTGNGDGCGAISKRKVHDSSMTIPEQNLRQLQSAAPLPITKVTREKNRIIIQQDAVKR